MYTTVVTGRHLWRWRLKQRGVAGGARLLEGEMSSHSITLCLHATEHLSQRHDGVRPTWFILTWVSSRDDTASSREASRR